MNFEKAIEFLRLRGEKVFVPSKADERILCFRGSDFQTSKLIEITMQTEFVARNEKFWKVCSKCLDLTKEEAQKELRFYSSIFGETLEIKNFLNFERPIFVYAHNVLSKNEIVVAKQVAGIEFEFFSNIRKKYSL